MLKRDTYKLILLFFSLLYLIFAFVYFARAAAYGEYMNTAALTDHFITLAIGPLKSIAVQIAFFGAVAAIVYVFWRLIDAARRNVDILAILKSGVLWQRMAHGMRNLVKTLTDTGVYLVPVLVGLILVSLTLSYVNELNATRLIDDVLLQWDKTLTGVYPSFILGFHAVPNWIVSVLATAYLYLSWVMVVAVMFFMFVRRKIFRELAVAFMLAFVFMLTLWLLFPAITPQNRFIDNVYNLPISAPVAEELRAYQPNENLTAFLEDMRERQNKLPFVTTSTMPSGHIVWAALFAFFLFRAHTLVGMLALPFFLLSSAGAVLLAEHYLVDVIGGVLVAAAAIALTFLASKADTERSINYQ